MAYRRTTLITYHDVVIFEKNRIIKSVNDDWKALLVVAKELKKVPQEERNALYYARMHLFHEGLWKLIDRLRFLQKMVFIDIDKYYELYDEIIALERDVERSDE